MPASTAPSVFLRYATVGLMANLGSYLAYLLLTWLGIGAKTSMTILYAASTLASFIGNRRWAFAHRGAWGTSFSRYLAAHVVGYGINFCLLLMLSDRMGYPHQWVQALAIIIVAAYLFIALRIFVFPSEKTSASAHE